MSCNTFLSTIADVYRYGFPQLFFAYQFTEYSRAYYSTPQLFVALIVLVVPAVITFEPYDESKLV